jgi:hypothetical protein
MISLIYEGSWNELFKLTTKKKCKTMLILQIRVKNLKIVFTLNQSLLKTKCQYKNPKFCDHKFITEMFTLFISRLEHYLQKFKEHYDTSYINDQSKHRFTM